jgi:hypothetical protein
VRGLGSARRRYGVPGIPGGNLEKVISIYLGLVYYGGSQDHDLFRGTEFLSEDLRA